MFFRRHPFVRDGLLSIVLAIVWVIGSDRFCKPPEGIICVFSRYLLDLIMGPVRFAAGKLMDFVFNITGIVPGPPGSRTTHPVIDFLSAGIGISLLLLYWFLLGGAVCVFWRLVRSQIQKVFAKHSSQS